jgi:hypothetical protein
MLSTKIFSKFNRHVFNSLHKETCPVRVLVKAAFAVNCLNVEVNEDDSFIWISVDDIHVRYCKNYDNVLVARETNSAGFFEEEVNRISDLPVQVAAEAVANQIRSVKAQSKMSTYLVHCLADKVDWVNITGENTIAVHVGDNDDSATGPSFMEIMFSVQEDRIVMSLFNEQEYSDDYGKHLQGTLLDTITDTLYWICGDFRSSESFIKDGEVSVPVSKFLPLV